MGSFVDHQFDEARSLVRMGVRGCGKMPNYSIETPCEFLTINGVDLALNQSVSKRHGFNGGSHKEILDDVAWGNSWSSEIMTYSELEALLGRLCGSAKMH